MPTHPRELVGHACLVWHPAPSAPAYGWESTERSAKPEADAGSPGGGRHFSVAVPARVLTTDPAINVRLARAGAGVIMVREDRVRDAVAHGELVVVLEAFSAPFPGDYLHYPPSPAAPPRLAASPALRALVDYLRRTWGR